jgi:hypothetical protein
MNNKRFGTITADGRVIEVSTGTDITHLFRKIMIDNAIRDGQALAFDTTTSMARSPCSSSRRRDDPIWP